jgi:hypothetical protein
MVVAIELRDHLYITHNALDRYNIFYFFLFIFTLLSTPKMGDQYLNA